MSIKFHPLSTATARNMQSGGFDYYGNLSERAISSGQGTPCRHCLTDIPKDEEMLILAFRPFPDDQPYAEVGPIFLCAKECESYERFEETPPILRTSPTYLIKGYNSENRIVYGTGEIVAQNEIYEKLTCVLEHENVKYADVRSAKNNCFLCRVTK